MMQSFKHVLSIFNLLTIPDFEKPFALPSPLYGTLTKKCYSDTKIMKNHLKLGVLCCNTCKHQQQYKTDALRAGRAFIFHSLSPFIAVVCTQCHPKGNEPQSCENESRSPCESNRLQEQ